MINSEQIQALKAAVDATPATEWEFHERYSLSHAGGGYVSINGVEAIWCLNKAVGGMAHSRDVLRYISAANPAVILSLLAERDADKALIAEQEKRIAELEQRHCGGALMEREEHHVGVVNKLLERIAELEAHTLTVKFPEDWHFEECETEGCQNGALFSVGKAAKNLHLCEACAKEPANSRLSKTALPKRLPFRIADGITLDVGE